METQKKYLTAPKPRKKRQTEKQLWEELRIKAKKAGLKPKEVAELLELDKVEATPADDSTGTTEE